jgi:hypothetical protein
VRQRRLEQEAREAAEAEAREAALRQRRLKAAQAELQRGKDLAGWAADEDHVDVPRGLALLQAMFDRCGWPPSGALWPGWQRQP